MGIGQAMTMPLSFSSNTVYPEQLMPGWLLTPTSLWLDLGVLAGAGVVGVTPAGALLPRLAS